jgi:hypothetical protein
MRLGKTLFETLYERIASTTSAISVLIDFPRGSRPGFHIEQFKTITQKANKQRTLEGRGILRMSLANGGR